VLAGSAAHSGGVFTIEAAGIDIWDTADQLHFAYQQLSGDIDFRARVESITAAHRWSKAGVMIRGALSAGAPHAYSLVSAGRGAAVQRRPAAGAFSAHTEGPAITAPFWVRLVRIGSEVTAYTSADGTNWAIVGTETVELGHTVYVGLAVTSHEASQRTTARFSNVAWRSLGLPAGQVSADIGGPAIRGGARFSNGVYTITGGGVDIWNAADEFHFVYQPVQGDVTVTARVAWVDEAHAWSKAGVMIRETLDPDARHAYALISASRGYAFQRRPTTGGWSEHTPGAAARAPGWVRLVRSGSLFEAFQSANGRDWTRIDSRVIGMVDTVYVGLAVTSHHAGAATTAAVDSLQITQAHPPSNQLPAVSLTAPSQGSSFTAPASITLAASAADADGSIARVDFYVGSSLVGSRASAPYSVTWAATAGSHTLTAVATDNAGATTISAGVTITVAAESAPGGAAADIGSPAIAGNAAFSNGTYTITAAGVDIWDGADQFHFVYQPMQGDVTVTARIASLTQAHEWSKAGVMIRESLAAGSRHAYSLVSAARGHAFQRRPQTGGVSEHTPGGSGGAPRWVRLVRTGSLFEAFSSPDGRSWTRIGSRTIAMRDTVYAGLAVTSHDASRSTTAVIDSVTVSAPPPAISEPPRAIVFTASADHATLVTHYALEIYAAGKVPGASAPVVTRNLGKPVPAGNGDILLELASFFEAIAPGEYLATVAAVGSGGTSRSPAVSFTR
jgi:regulation of enolase protein 1 (concanavalin A-like superfamily)